MKFVFLTFVFLILTPSGFSEVLDDCVCGLDTFHAHKNHKSQKIVNGTEVRPHSYPWMAILTDRWSSICGGSIITDRTILSAGHCIFYIMFPEETRWIVGFHGIQEAFDNQELSYNYLAVKLHPRHRSTKLFDIYDMSIFILDRQITFNYMVKPICLPNADDDKKYWHWKVIVAGWGRIEEDGPSTDLLTETKVVLKTDEECKKMTGLTNYNHNAMMCAHEKYKDACQGDSGGPLFVEKLPNHYVILGVVSWGEGCAQDSPGVYAKISNQETLLWIQSVNKMAEANECLNTERFGRNFYI